MILQLNFKRLRVSFPWHWKWGKSYGYTQTSPKKNSGIRRNPSQRANPATFSVLPDDDNIITASLSDSEGERHACITQADVPQPTGIRSGKSYLKQCEKITDETQQQATSVQVPIPAPVLTLGKEKQKEVQFDLVLKKPSGLGLNVPFRFDILAHLENIPARITIHELLYL